jgi:excisionase family DNA binding protein
MTTTTPQHVTTVAAYTLTEAAKKLGVSRMTLWRAIKDGKLASHRQNNTTLLYSADLLDYVLSYRGGDGVPGA